MQLIKWKYEDLMTIDLLVSEDPEGHINLQCNGPDNILIDCTRKGAGSISFGTFSSYRLRTDLGFLMQQNSGSRNTIAEVAYDASSGVWTYFHFRDDKVSPNHISTVMSVFMEQAEAIGADELEYRLLARSEAENDFTAQIVSMRSKALDFQRKRTSSTATAPR